MSMSRALLCMTAALLFCGPSIAQQGASEEAPSGEDGATADVNPLDVLRGADKALADLKSFSCSMRNEGFGAMATHTPTVTGKLQARRDAAGTGWVFNMEGDTAPAGQVDSSAFRIAFDGTTGRSVDDARRLVHETSSAGVNDLLKSGPGRILNWLPMWNMVITRPLAESEDSLAVSYEGRAVVGGVACDVVRQDTSDFTELDEYVLWWFLGVDDHLPRRLDSFYLETEGGTNGLDVLTITDVRAGAEVSDSVLAITVPDGYTVEKVEATKSPSRGFIAAQQGPASLVGKPAPAWTLKDAAGLDHSLADYRGKVVLIDFWATWCGWCVRGMPAIQKLHEKYQGKDVAVIGITVWEAGNPAKFMKDNGYTYGLLLGTEEIPAAYGIQGIPRLFVIGKDGSIIHDTTGYDEKAEANLSEVIDKALAAPAGK